MTKREDETQTAFLLRCIRNEIIEEVADRVARLNLPSVECGEMIDEAILAMREF